MTAPPATPPLRTWRPMALWTAGILLVLGLTWFVGAMVVPVWQVYVVVKDYNDAMRYHKPVLSAKTRLGTPEHAAAKVRLYLRVMRPQEERRLAAVAVFSECACDSVPALTDALGDGDWLVRQQSATLLGCKRSLAASAIPALEQVLGDQHSEVRFAAAEALRMIRRGETEK